jgi:hypothetical protein
MGVTLNKRRQGDIGNKDNGIIYFIYFIES